MVKHNNAHEDIAREASGESAGASATLAGDCLSCSLNGAGWHHGHEDGTAASRIELHGDTAALHHYVAGHDSFEHNTRLLRESDAVGKAVGTWVTRPSMRQLRAMVPLLASLNIRHWELRFLHWATNTRLIPRLAMASTRALQAAKVARDHGIEVSLVGAPRCLLGPFEALAQSEEPRSFAQSCAPCVRRSICCGVAPRYLERFGDEDLRVLRT